MSSHREAPEISKDPVADSTDLYAFVSPDKKDTVTLIANYVPLQLPAGGPNFYEFGDDVLYQIHIDNNGDGRADISYQFRFRTELTDPDTFLYNTGPIESIGSRNWNRRQFYDVTVVNGRAPRTLGSRLACPPCNIGPLSTPTAGYPGIAAAAVHDLGGGVTVFAGQRAEAFYVDLGSIFDLADLRPFQNLHTTFAMPGLSGRARGERHQLPERALDRDPGADLAGDQARGTRPSACGPRPAASGSRCGTPTSGENVNSGPFRQVSRLGNPLFNEVLVPLGKKDLWNSLPPADDKLFAQYVTHPELAGLLPVLYPGVFPHLAALDASKKPRADLEAILLTGIPAGRRPGFHQLHRARAGRHAPAQHLDPAHPGGQAEHLRAARRGRGRLPERPPGVRRRGGDRVAGHRWRHVRRWSTSRSSPTRRPASSPTG